MVAPRQQVLTVGVCTFRRLSLEATLRSLAGQQVPGVTVRVVIADNDIAPSARPMVERLAAELGLDFRYLHAPAQNISTARNACLDACAGVEGSDWLAFIDDDEIAKPGWLSALCAHRRADIAALFGPVKAVYPDKRPFCISFADTHSSTMRLQGNTISEGYAGNVLINLSHPAVAKRRFDLGFGQSGGEDQEYFDAIYRDSGRFYFVPQAVIEEPVAPERDGLGWLVARRFSSGNHTARILLKNGTRRDILSRLAKVAIHLPISIAATAVLWVRPRLFLKLLLRICGFIGFLSCFLGIKRMSAYGHVSDRVDFDHG